MEGKPAQVTRVRGQELFDHSRSNPLASSRPDEPEIPKIFPGDQMGLFTVWNDRRPHARRRWRSTTDRNRVFPPRIRSFGLTKPARRLRALPTRLDAFFRGYALIGDEPLRSLTPVPRG